MSENDVKNAIIDALNKMGHYAFLVNNLAVRGRSLPKRQPKGLPDIHCALKGGKYLYVETKFGKEKQSTEQKEFQRRVEALGHVYLVAYSLDEFLKQYEA